MLDIREEQLSVNVNDKVEEGIIDIFKAGNTVQLPVIDDNMHVIGIVDIYDVIANMGRPIKDIMIGDVEVAGKDKGVFSFKNYRQDILPIVDSDKKLKGFVNKNISKVYLPNREYMRVVEEKIIDKDISEMSPDEAALKFDALISSNYDGIYITTEPGTTIGLRSKETYVQDLGIDNVDVNNESVSLTDEGGDAKKISVTTVENLQVRNETSITDKNMQDGDIVRIVNKLKDFDSIKEELRVIREVADKYEEELEFLRWEQTHTDELVAESPVMRQIVNMAVKIAPVDSTVLLEGPSGVGKGVIGQLIHNNSLRTDGPFIKIDCGLIPEHLLESELFGYEKGAFTGADPGGKKGRVYMANGGTLFLDEIGEMPLNLQPKLLRLIQDRVITRVGGEEELPVNVRVIAATNRNLKQMVQDGTFREDLYYRLNVVPIEIPSLKERPEDVKALIPLFLKKYNLKYNQHKEIDSLAMRELLAYSWPGNVREMENIIEFLIVTSKEDIVERENLPSAIYDNRGKNSDAFTLAGNMSLKEAVAMIEERMLRDAKDRCGSMEEAAKLLKVDRTTVLRKMQKYNIK